MGVDWNGLDENRLLWMQHGIMYHLKHMECHLWKSGKLWKEIGMKYTGKINLKDMALEYGCCKGEIWVEYKWNMGGVWVKYG